MNGKSGLLMKNIEKFKQFKRKINLTGVSSLRLKQEGKNVFIGMAETIWSFILVQLFKCVITPGPLWYLFVSILDLSLYSSPITAVLFSIYLILCLSLQLQRLIASNSQHHKQDQKKFLIWADNKFTEKPSKEIIPGDIILLQENDQVPADLILIASGNLNKNCYVDNTSITGEADLQRRECVREIQSLIDSLDVNEAGFYLNAVDASIWFNEPDLNFMNFSAKLKVKGSPKSVMLTYRNMLWRSSVIKISSWVFGMALYVGPETKEAMLNKNCWDKQSVFDKKIDLFFFCLIAINLFFALFHFLLSIYAGSDDSSAELFLEYIVLYHYIIPFPVLYFRILGRVLFCLKLRMNTGIQVNNPAVIESLSEIEFMIIEKNEYLTNKNLKIHECIIGSQIYPVEKKSKPRFNDYEVASVDSSRKSSRKSSEFELLNTQFLLGIALCNSAYPQENNSFIALSDEDLCLAKLASENGVKLVYKDSKKININFESSIKEFKVLFFRHPSNYSKRTRILVYFFEENKHFLFVRGPAESMEEYLEETELLKINEIKSMVPGIQIHILAKRELTKKENSEILYDYKTALLCPVNKEGRIENVIEQCESKCTYLGIISIEDQIPESSKETINSLLSNGISLWLTSGDSENSTIGSAIGAGLIDKPSDIIKISNCDTIEELRASLEEVLEKNVFIEPNPKLQTVPIFDQFKVDDEKIVEIGQQSSRRSEILRRASFHPLISQISNIRQGTLGVFKDINAENLDYVLAIDGKCIELGISSNELLRLLSLALFTAKSVVCYNMMPNHKVLLAGILKDNFASSPKFMAIGSKCDSGMINEAHIGVSKQVGDIVIRDFSDIQTLIFSYGLAVHCISIRLIEISVYFNVSFVLLVIFFHYFSGFSGNWIVDKKQFVLLGIIQQLSLLVPQYVNSKFYLRHDEFCPPYILKKMYLLDIAYWIGFGVLGSGISLALIYLTFFCSISDKGFPEDSEQLGVFVYLHYSFILLGIGFVEFHLASKVSLISILLTGLIVAVFVISNNFISDSENFHAYSIFFYTPSNVFSVFMSSLVVIAYYLAIRSRKILKEKKNRSNLNCSAEVFRDLQLPSRFTDYGHNLGKAFKYSDNHKATLIDEELKIMPLSLKFNIRSKEKSFVQESYSLNQKTHLIYMQIYAVSHFIIFFYSGFRFLHILWAKVLFWTFSGLLFTMSLSLFSPLYKNNAVKFIRFFFILSNIMTIFSICLLYDSFSSILSGFLLIQLLIVGNNWVFYLILTIIQVILDIYYKSLIFHSNQYYLANYAITLISISLILSTITYILEYKNHKEYIIISEVNSKIVKSNNVLSLLLPHFVMTRVKSGARYISLDQGIVSVLFCNICDFEELFKDLTPYELTTFLDDLFRKFDQLCEIVGVTKIETVGKTYMASAGLKDSEAELDPNISKVPHARRMIELGFGMINIIKKVKIKHSQVHVKIGINSGEVRAGVVGNHKPQFSLVGDTVNIASRMASTLTEYDSIQITDKTYELIKDSQGICFDQRECFVKGKGQMTTYIVKLPNNFESIGIDCSPGSDFKNSLAFSSLSGYISTHSTIPGTILPEIGTAGKERKQIYAEIEYRESLMFINKSSGFIEKIRMFSCKFKETEKEKKFRVRTLEDSFYIFFGGLIVAVFYYSCQVIIEIAFIVNDSGQVSGINLWFCIIQLTILSGLLKFLNSFYKTLWFAWALNLIYWYPQFILIYLDSASSMSPVITSLKISLHALFLTQTSILLYNHIFLLSMAYFITWLTYASINPSTTSIFTLLFIVLCQITVYHKEKSIRIFTNLKTTAAKDSKSIEDLLTHMVPSHAYQNLMDEDSVIDKLSQVTMIYADIVGFTAWSSNKNPEEVVNMLSEMFKNFDNLCLVHNVYKVHTIGDCYVAMSYISNRNRDPGQECLNVINFAIAMKQSIEDTNDKYSMGISMRIGIHTGDVIGGITGRSIVRYDIYGTDSYIANQMESNGLSGQIALSHISKNLISQYRPSLFNFTEHKEIQVLNSTIQIFLLTLNNS